jgi:hypothetical protein
LREHTSRNVHNCFRMAERLSKKLDCRTLPLKSHPNYSAFKPLSTSANECGQIVISGRRREVRKNDWQIEIFGPKSASNAPQGESKAKWSSDEFTEL